MTSSLLGGIETPSLPLVIMSSFGYPHPSLYTRKWQEKLIRDKKACTVADEYRFSSDVPSMFRFDITTEMKIKFKNPKNGGLPKISVKRGYFVIMSSFGRPPRPPQVMTSFMNSP